MYACNTVRMPCERQFQILECYIESVKMPKSYSEDLRWRAVWLAVVRGKSVQEIAFVLFV